MASARDQPRLPWTDPDWRAEATAWGEQTLHDLGRPVIGRIEQPHIRPWATAFTLPTADGIVWLKAPIAPLAHEAATLALLNARRERVAPVLLAKDDTRGWMLIDDAGERLREVTPRRIERWAEVVAHYAQLQLDVAADVDDLVRRGVPDRRGRRLAEQLDELVQDESVLTSDDGALTDDEIARLRAVVPRIDASTAELDEIGVPASIHHDDLHDGNVFLDGDTCRVIDWGDACIAHPLLTIDLTLRVIERVFEVGSNDREVERVHDAYLEPFTAYAPREDLLAAAPARTVAAEACNTVKWHDIMRAVPRESRGEFAEVIPTKLRRLLETCG